MQSLCLTQHEPRNMRFLEWKILKTCIKRMQSNQFVFIICSYAALQMEEVRPAAGNAKDLEMIMTVSLIFPDL